MTDSSLRNSFLSLTDSPNTRCKSAAVISTWQVPYKLRIRRLKRRHSLPYSRARTCNQRNKQTQSSGVRADLEETACIPRCHACICFISFLFFFFFFKGTPLFIYLFVCFFVYGCVGSSFLCEGFLQLRRAGATLSRGARASHYRGLSCCGAQAPDAQAQ